MGKRSWNARPKSFRLLSSKVKTLRKSRAKITVTDDQNRSRITFKAKEKHGLNCCIFTKFKRSKSYWIAIERKIACGLANEINLTLNYTVRI